MVLIAGVGGGSHLKLADMGACLPYSATARSLVARSREIVASLRDGDWCSSVSAADATRQSGAVLAAQVCSAQVENAGISASGVAASSDGVDDDEVEEVDWRVEGTVEYLSPEVRSGASLPTVASDAYAFGVTLYQILAGRLPDVDAIWGLSSAEAAHGHHVRFAEEPSRAQRPGAHAAGGGFPPGFPLLAADLVRGLLHPDPAQRLGGGERGLAEVAEHGWFAPLLRQGSGSATAALGALHRQVSPTSLPGLAAPASDPSWSRRHYSSMWAPLPRAYTTFLAAGGGQAQVTAVADEVGSGSSAPILVTLASCVFAEILPPLAPS